MAFEAARVLDRMDSTTGWGVINGTMELAAANVIPHGKGIKVTHTSGSYALLQKTNVGKTLIGKYLRFFLTVHGTAQVEDVTFYVYTGPSADARYYWGAINRFNGRLSDGEQWVDVHLDQLTKVNNPDSRSDITLVKFTVTSVTGQVGAVTISHLESVSRKPYIVFVNDSPRAEFIEDILPMLIARGLPCQVQLLDVEVAAYKATPESPGSTYVPLSKLQRLIGDGWVSGGVHANFQQVDDATFFNYLRGHVNDIYHLGLGQGLVHCTSYQSNFGNSTRHEYANKWFPMIRRGAYGKPQLSHSLNGLHVIPPCAGIYSWDIPAAEFNENTTESQASAWITDAIALEKGLYVFGHGSDRYQYTSRSPIAVYHAFLTTFDANRDRIDWLTPAQWYQRYCSVRPDLRNPKSVFTY